MILVTRQLRGLAIALVILGLSAGVVLGAHGLQVRETAAHPASSDASESPEGSETPEASDDAESESPAASDEDDSSETADPSESADPSETADPSESADPSDASDATSDGSHGSMVSEAAGMDTPAGFANHGAFVSCVARQNHGHLAPDATPMPIAELTPEACAKTSSAPSDPSTAGGTKDKKPTAHGPSQHGAKGKRHGGH
jgi:cytoskeletal protein RodZ